MNDEQRRVALFQAQPGGLGLFFRPAALSFAHVEQLHVAHSALLDEKIAPAGPIGLVLTGPKAECNLDTQLPAYIKTFAAETDTAVNLKDGAVNKKAKGRVLNVEFSNVVGAGGGAWSGAKFVAVKGELFENGKKIGSFNGRRTSGGGFFGAYKGTCKILDRCVKALGKDIALWMIDPTMDAMIGEF